MMGGLAPEANLELLSPRRDPRRQWLVKSQAEHPAHPGQKIFPCSPPPGAGHNLLFPMALATLDPRGCGCGYNENEEDRS